MLKGPSHSGKMLEAEENTEIESRVLLTENSLMLKMLEIFCSGNDKVVGVLDF